MDAGDTLHILIKDLTGTGVTIGLNDSDGNEEDNEPVGFTTTPTPTTTLATTTPLPPLLDKDGNEYTTVTIGTQEWIVENFRSETYADGTPIPNLTDDGDWIADVTGAYCYYDNDEATYKGDYGTLYNWYAVSNASGLAYLERNGVQEVGWRVPIKTDLDTLKIFIGGIYEGNKLKEAGLDHWNAPNNATDDYGFRAVGAGTRIDDGSYIYIKESILFFTSEEDIADPPNVYTGQLIDYVEGIGMWSIYSLSKQFGCSIKLVRDI